MSDENEYKRSLLLGARIRFSPSGATIRQQAIERIIVQSLASGTNEEGLTEKRLQQIATLDNQLTILRSSDVRVALKALHDSQTIQTAKINGVTYYSLSSKAKSDASQVIAESDHRIETVVSQLFPVSTSQLPVYRIAFLRLLCIVFSKLSDEYVRIIAKQENSKNIAESHILANALNAVLKIESNLDDATFRYGITRFFSESCALYDSIKWNTAQSYYIAKALGLDGSTDLLSADIFQGASLYCDTNVLIAGLIPENRNHNSILEMHKACATLGMSLKVTRITVEELKHVIRTNVSILKETYDKIPEDTKPKVWNFLLESFISQKREFPDLTIDEFIEGFQTPLRTLKESFGLQEEDSKWFVEAKVSKKTDNLAKRLSEQFQNLRGRSKRLMVAKHDAMLLQWIAKVIADGENAWLVTLDCSLAKWTSTNDHEDARAITLDALLQWITPVLGTSSDDDGFASIFSDTIRYRLLPMDQFFQLSDFLIFAEMGIETRDLPAIHVEGCIRELKKVGPTLDPSKPADREKMGHVINRYFTDPATKINKELQEARNHISKLSEELDIERKDKMQVLTELESTKKRLDKTESQLGSSDTTQREQKTALEEAEKRIARLEDNLNLRRNEEKRKSMISSIVLRSVIFALLFIVVEVFVAWMSNKYGVGQNLFQRLTNSWKWLTLGALVSYLLFSLSMGRERMRMLIWWKGDKE